MKVSTKGRYGLTIMMDLAHQCEGKPIPLKSVAKRHGLSEHYLEQLIAPLRNAGLVRSVRGAYGGYVLAHPADKITAGDIIRVLEGPISPVELDEEVNEAQRELWARVQAAIEKELDETTVADLIRTSQDGDEKDYYMFYI
ncbi:cysteine metabolism transcriptional regulator CymR [Mechercharimyces sp. CAU 1602]|uniref:cysteine metabolism transcriptional regulator CymR n=1 Tax=Mechercharimyces sp. CAU 1602 TaxID=2973933 RepID=UPI0021621395|nr:Rrf2 family transcriptional regulator [Mechercharimyces sp. CAU 1602]MCS1350253.1 Rrf2 family transcriptional regulator [Mechercharimyces sp. CAU 1602]